MATPPGAGDPSWYKNTCWVSVGHALDQNIPGPGSRGDIRRQKTAPRGCPQPAGGCQTTARPTPSLTTSQG